MKESGQRTGVIESSRRRFLPRTVLRFALAQLSQLSPQNDTGLTERTDLRIGAAGEVQRLIKITLFLEVTAAGQPVCRGRHLRYRGYRDGRFWLWFWFWFWFWCELDSRYRSFRVGQVDLTLQGWQRDGPVYRVDFLLLLMGVQQVDDQRQECQGSETQKYGHPVFLCSKKMPDSINLPQPGSTTLQE